MGSPCANAANDQQKLRTKNTFRITSEVRNSLSCTEFFRKCSFFDTFNREKGEFCCMSQAKHIALVEIAGSHDECLYTQVRALADCNCRLFWVTSTAMKERNPHLVPFFTDILLVDTVSKPLADLRKMKEIVRYLQEKKVEKWFSIRHKADMFGIWPC